MRRVNYKRFTGNFLIREPFRGGYYYIVFVYVATMAIIKWRREGNDKDINGSKRITYTRQLAETRLLIVLYGAFRPNQPKG